MGGWAIGMKLKIGDNDLGRISEIKYLGLTFDEKLTLRCYEHYIIDFQSIYRGWRASVLFVIMKWKMKSTIYLENQRNAFSHYISQSRESIWARVAIGCLLLANLL